MRKSTALWSIVAFFFGTQMALFGVLILLLNGECSCGLGRMPTTAEFSNFMHLVALFTGVWAILISVVAARNHFR